MVRIAVIGSLNMDLVIRAPRIPKPGETVLGADNLLMIPGGKGANQAYASARLGAEVAMIGRVGGDTFGEQMINSLKKAGVDTQHIIHETDASTGVALIVVEEGGQNSIVVSSGANSRITPSDISQAEAVIRSANLILLQLEIPLPAVVKAAQCARHHGVKVILNPAPAQHLPTELLSLTDILIPNETETAILSGYDVGTEDEIRHAASGLRQSGIKTIIMTQGCRGALLITENGIEHFPAIPVKPVDTTAAGDAFVGSFAVALAEGRSLREAVRHGNAAGALTSTKQGAQPSIPSRDDLDKMLKTM
ncbi:sugar kinase [Candidatus Scalindua japonica]|uniref:Ribokinase n=1 Tax=Candidatus Scalindua japonica TaxID=1284222 RepID=A0A286U1I0_9BACT|nr:ribokinase [Candidatus Scalindua japonica]GAX61999.1 sugar kinase [Candidatus Scalindua japonica]